MNPLYYKIYKIIDLNISKLAATLAICFNKNNKKETYSVRKKFRNVLDFNLNTNIKTVQNNKNDKNSKTNKNLYKANKNRSFSNNNNKCELIKVKLILLTTVFLVFISYVK